MLEKLVGVSIDDPEDIEEARLQTLSKEDLIEELKRAKLGHN